MIARARIVAETDGRGGTRLAELYGEAPLLPRCTGPGEIHLVGGAAGPLGGDHLCVEVHVRAGAELTARTVAATVVLPGRAPSRVELAIRVEEGALLRWLPEPLVASAGCDHVHMSTVELAETARLVWREELVLGRSGEAPGRVRTGLRVRRAGRALLSQDLAAGPDADGWAGAAVFGGNRTVGSVLVVDPRWTPTPPDARTVVDGALMPLTGPAMLATAVAPDAHTLRARLAALAPTDTTQQQVVHSIEMNEDCTGHRPANQAGRA